MSRVNRTILLALLASTAVTAQGATLPRKHSTAFDWRYEMDVMPTTQDLNGNGVDDFVIGTAGTASSSVADGVLTISTPTSGHSNQFFRGDGSAWPGNFPAADGYTLEARVKVVSSAGLGPFGLLASPVDSIGHAALNVHATGQSWGMSSPGAPLGAGTYNNTDAYHVFRVATADHANFQVWRDGVQIGQDLAKSGTHALDRILFGNIGGAWYGEVLVDYMRFTHGAYAPDPRLNVFDMAPGLKNLDFVTVGNRSNAPAGPSNTNYDENAHAAAFGHGAVDYDYRIGKYEVTNAQYAEFLKAAAATDVYGLYHANMASSTWGGITRDGQPGSYTYSVKENMGNKPVNFVSWYDAARFANWLTTGDTESGVYNTTDWSVDRSFRNDDGIAYALPTEDEWYKAAYYDPDTESYFLYPTGSDTAPASEVPSGGENSANYAGPITPPSQGNLSDVGAYLDSASPYGTFDQGGNLFEWNETWIWHEEQWKRGSRGGSFYHSSLADELAASAAKMSWAPTGQYATYGFRVVMIPEPGAFGLLLCGAIAGLMWRRRPK